MIDISNMRCHVLAKLISVVRNEINVTRVTGDISPILSNLGCRDLTLSEINITERSLPPEIKDCSSKKVRLIDLKGETTSLIKLLRCYRMYIEQMTLSSEDTRCILGYLNTTTAVLSLGTGVECDFDILSTYDGTGRCWTIEFDWDVHDRYAPSIRTMIKKLGWRKKENELSMQIYRPKGQQSQSINSTSQNPQPTQDRSLELPKQRSGSAPNFVLTSKSKSLPRTMVKSVEATTLILTTAGEMIQSSLKRK